MASALSVRDGRLPARWAGLAPLLVVLGVRLALGLAYSQIVPAWESYDEDGHFAYARYLAVNRTLVLRPDDPETDQIWEKFQPPLYYNLIAPVIAGFDLGENFVGPALNPYFTAGNAGVNYALHPAASPAEEQLIRAVRAARAVSVLISTLSVICVYVAAGRIWPGERATVLAATSLYAFWPQFLFVGSMVTNDVLVTALAAWALVPAVGFVINGFRLRRVLVLAGLITAAMLAKLNAASLVPVAGAALAFSLFTGARLGHRWRLEQIGLVVGTLALAVAGALWALGSLEFVTGQIFQVATVRELVRHVGPGGGGTRALVSAALPYAFRTYFASFGWGNLETFSWAYWLWPVGAILAVLGLAMGIGRRRLAPRQAAAYALMVVFIVSLLGMTLALAVAHQNVYLVPGRYLLPTLPAVVILLAGGWRELISRGAARFWASRLFCAASGLLGWAILVWTLLPAYARPAALTTDTAQVDVPQAIFYDRRIELIGYSGPEAAVAGQALAINLCWQAVAPVMANYTLYLEVVGADSQGYGRLETFPGFGNYPTSAWAVNTPFCEDYTLEMGKDIPAPALAQLRVRWIDQRTGRRLPVTTLSDERLPGGEARIMFRVAAPPSYHPGIANEVNFGFGGSGQYPNLRLTGYAVEQDGQEAVVTLRWQAQTTVPGNYSVFVHLRDTPETSFALGDSQPRAGAYPTWMWQPGEVLLDVHRLTLPALPSPALQLYVGLLNPAQDARVAAYDADGVPLEHDEVLLAAGLEFR